METSHLREIHIVALVRQAVQLVVHFRDELESQEDVDFARGVFERIADLENDPVELDDMRVGDFFGYPAFLPLLDGEQTLYEEWSRPRALELLASHERRKRRGITTDEEVAEAYRTAYALNQPVTEAVAATFGWALQTARNRIARARQAGLLPPTVVGSARYRTRT